MNNLRMDDGDNRLLAETMQVFSLRAPKRVAAGCRSELWKVARDDGSPAALKLYREESFESAAPGIGLMRAWNGAGAAKLLGTCGRAVLLEWLDGPSLAEIARAGLHEQAAGHLVDVAAMLHLRRIEPPADLPYLSDWFDPLLAFRLAPGLPEKLRRDIGAARFLAQWLLGSQQDIRPLHGNLHPDNIRLGPRGHCAIDARGVLGERAFELARGFCTPGGDPTPPPDAAAIRRLADLWSWRFAVDRRRLLGWAAAQCGLEIARGSRDAFGADAGLLSELLVAIEA